MSFQFSAFADESSNSFAGQIDALKRNNLSYLEIRNLDGKNVTELTVCEARELARIMDDQGLRVWSIGSPIGKIHIETGDFAAHLEPVNGDDGMFPLVVAASKQKVVLLMPLLIHLQSPPFQRVQALYITPVPP